MLVLPGSQSYLKDCACLLWCQQLMLSCLTAVKANGLVMERRRRYLLSSASTIEIRQDLRCEVSVIAECLLSADCRRAHSEENRTASCGGYIVALAPGAVFAVVASRNLCRREWGPGVWRVIHRGESSAPGQSRMYLRIHRSRRCARQRYCDSALRALLKSVTSTTRL